MRSTKYCRSVGHLAVGLHLQTAIFTAAIWLLCRHPDTCAICPCRKTETAVRQRRVSHCAHGPRAGGFQRRSVQRPTAQRLVVRDANVHATNNRRSIGSTVWRGNGERVDHASLVLHAQIASRLQRAPDLAGRSPLARGVCAGNVTRRPGARSGRGARHDLDALRPRDPRGPARCGGICRAGKHRRRRPRHRSRGLRAGRRAVPNSALPSRIPIATSRWVEPC